MGVTFCIVAIVVPSFLVFRTIESKHTHSGRLECMMLLLSMKSGSFNDAFPQMYAERGMPLNSVGNKPGGARLAILSSNPDAMA